MTTKAPPEHHGAGPFNTQIIVNHNDANIARKCGGQHVRGGTSLPRCDTARIPLRGAGRGGAAADVEITGSS